MNNPQELTELENKGYGKWSSWAIWNDDIRDTSVIRNNVPVLNVDHVIIGLNVSEPLKKAWSNFHSGANDWKLQRLVNKYPKLKGAYMTDLIKRDEPNSSKIDTYIADYINSSDIKIQITNFQKELSVVGVNKKSKFILLGKQVQKYFTFFIDEPFYSNRRIFIPHYSGRGTAKEWLDIAYKALIEDSIL